MTPHRPRRGLTLIEVLASIVILTMLAVTCVPLLRQAAGARPIESSIDLLELSRFADAVLEEPTAHGIESFENVQDMELSWPDDSQRAPARLVRLEAEPTDDENPPDHVWLIFDVGDLQVLRYVVIERDKEPTP